MYEAKKSNKKHGKFMMKKKKKLLWRKEKDRVDILHDARAFNLSRGIPDRDESAELRGGYVPVVFF